MPVEAVVIDTTIEAVGAREPSQGEICVVGHDAGGTAPDNTVTEVTQSADADTQFGSGTDIAEAIKVILKQRVPKVYAIRATQNDIVGESVTQGSLQTLANFPVAGRPLIVIDAGAVTVEFTYTTPVDPGVNKAEVNAKTGQIYINGAGSSLVDYSYIDWTTAFDAVAAFLPEIDIVVMGNAPEEDNGKFYGDHDELVSRVDSEEWVTVIMSAGDETASVIATSFNQTEYQSRNVVAIAHKSTTDDVAAAVAGLLSVIEPWKKLMWKTVRSLTTTYFTKTEVETTLENATTPVNAIIQKVDLDMPSDGLTTTGADTYEWIDITRTRYYLEDIITTGLDDLVRTSEVPYDEAGIASVRSAIERALENAVVAGALRTPFINDDGDYQRGFSVEVPKLADIPTADRQDRVLKNIYVTGWLAGHVQSIQLNLAIKI